MLVGAIAGAFGVRGEARLRCFTADPEGVVRYGPLFDKAGRLVLTPKRWRAVKDGLAVSGPEITTREQAEALRGTALHVPRDRLPPPEDEEFYHVDLIGCRAETLDGAVVGEVTAVHDFGAGDILEIRAPQGRTLYVAFTRENVPVVDVVGRRVVIAPADAEGDPE